MPLGQKRREGAASAAEPTAGLVLCAEMARRPLPVGAASATIVGACRNRLEILG